MIPFNNIPTITYYPFGDIASLTLGNGQLQTFTRDQRYALTALTDGYNGATTAYASLAYTYDALGNITSITDSSAGTYGDYVFSYDHLSQLTGSTITPGGTNTVYHQAFTYNLAGNRLSKTEGAATYSYTYDDHTNRRPSRKRIPRRAGDRGPGRDQRPGRETKARRP